MGQAIQLISIAKLCRRRRKTLVETVPLVSTRRKCTHRAHASSAKIPRSIFLTDSDKAVSRNCRQWNHLRMEPMVGIEPTTYGLRNRCSTTELHWLSKRAENSHIFAGWQEFCACRANPQSRARQWLSCRRRRGLSIASVACRLRVRASSFFAVAIHSMYAPRQLMVQWRARAGASFLHHARIVGGPRVNDVFGA